MMKSLAAAALTATVLVAGIADANALTRSGGGTTASGKTFSSTGTRSCAGGSCSQQQTATGPRGNTAVRTGSGSCSGGTCTTNRTVTGPDGRGFNRGSTFSR